MLIYGDRTAVIRVINLKRKLDSNMVIGICYLSSSTGTVYHYRYFKRYNLYLAYYGHVRLPLTSSGRANDHNCSKSHHPMILSGAMMTSSDIWWRCLL